MRRRIWPCAPYLLGVGAFACLVVGLYGIAFGLGVAAFCAAIKVWQERDGETARPARRWL